MGGGSLLMRPLVDMIGSLGPVAFVFFASPNMPAEVEIFATTFIGIIGLDIYRGDEITNEFIKIEAEDQPRSDVFDKLDFGTQNFLLASGSTYWPLLLGAILYVVIIQIFMKKLFVKIAKNPKFSNRCVRKIAMSLSEGEGNLPGVITEFLICTFFDLVMFEIIHFRRMFELHQEGKDIWDIYFSTPIDSTPTVMASITLVGLLYAMYKSIIFIKLIRSETIKNQKVIL